MRPPLSRLLLAVVLSAPIYAVSAPVERPALSPVLNVARAQTPLRETMQGYVSMAASLSVHPSPNLAFLESGAAASDPVRAESARLIGALIADPQALAAHDAELRAALGDFHVDVLLKTAARLHEQARADAPLAAELSRMSHGLDLASAASVQSAAARLNSFFEGSKSAPPSAAGGDVVDARDAAAKKPLVVLTKHGEPPLMSEAELEAYVLRHRITSPKGLSRANFESGVYRPEYDAALKKLGIDLVMIEAPSRAELGRFKEEDGYHLKSEYVRWVTPVRSLEEFKKDMRPSRRKTFEDALKKSQSIPHEIGPLTVDKFEQWYPIYEDEIVFGKDGGKRNVVKSWARDLQAQGLLGERHAIFYYDQKDPSRMVGGVTLRAWKEKGMLVGNFAAYRPELKKAMSPHNRTFALSLEYAQKLGYPVFSLGEDTDFYGYDYNIGLMESKSAMKMTPYPSDKIVLMKVIDTRKIANVKTKEGKNQGYLFFGINRDSVLVERYLHSKETEATPKEAQDLMPGIFFSPDVPPAKDVTVLWHYKGNDDKNPTPTPGGDVPYKERKMAQSAP